MGADAVGLGKPAVYAMAAYGEEGIVRMLEVLRGELETCMRLVGAPSLAHLRPELVDASALTTHHSAAYPTPESPYAAAAAAAAAASSSPSHASLGGVSGAPDHAGAGVGAAAAAAAA
eukprot:COSAG01_NODE_4986_length_4569_cov_6.806711_6_plen_117_part_01